MSCRIKTEFGVELSWNFERRLFTSHNPAFGFLLSERTRVSRDTYTLQIMIPETVMQALAIWSIIKHKTVEMSERFAIRRQIGEPDFSCNND